MITLDSFHIFEFWNHMTLIAFFVNVSITSWQYIGASKAKTGREKRRFFWGFIACIEWSSHSSSSIVYWQLFVNVLVSPFRCSSLFYTPRLTIRLPSSCLWSTCLLFFFFWVKTSFWSLYVFQILVLVLVLVSIVVFH